MEIDVRGNRQMITTVLMKKTRLMSKHSLCSAATTWPPVTASLC